MAEDPNAHLREVPWSQILDGTWLTVTVAHDRVVESLAAYTGGPDVPIPVGDLHPSAAQHIENARRRLETIEADLVVAKQEIDKAIDSQKHGTWT